MTIERKVGMGIAGQPSGGPTDVAEVFSTHLWKGTGYAQTITNGIDLAGEGGLVWIKSRTPYAAHHALLDTERGVTKIVKTSSTASEITASNYLTSFNSTGFSVSHSNEVSYANGDFVSWTFRKKKKFFDVVTYTGNGVAGREIAHGLGGPVGMMIIKQTSSTTGWATWHKGADSGNAYLELNETDAQNTNGRFFWGNNTSYIAPTSTEFTVATDSVVNDNGQTYIAYIFADNSSEDAEDQMIKCGSVTTGNVNTDVAVNLGWEPQWILMKNSGASSQWFIADTMRGWVSPTGVTNQARILKANSSGIENNGNFVKPTATGFTVVSDNLGSAQNWIYMAIRAPMMVEPEAATDVFAVTTRNVANDSKAPEFRSTFPVDMALRKWNTSDPTQIVSRLTQGKYLTTNSSNTEQVSSTAQFDYNNGWSSNASGANTDLTSWMWKRAKGYMDVVAYTGTGANRTLPHSLSVVPEMMWVKSRTTAEQWIVYHSSMTLSVGTSPPHRIISYLNLTNRPATDQAWDNQAPTDSVFSIGTPNTVNQSTKPYIAYLFATLDGVSKCGGYTGNGSSQTISCGFSAGSRFVLIHRTDDPDDDGASGSWYVWDSVRGIVAGNDPHFSLHTNNGDITNDDSVDPHNSGFIVNQVSATDINVSSGKYIFYAIA